MFTVEANLQLLTRRHHDTPSLPLPSLCAKSVPTCRTPIVYLSISDDGDHLPGDMYVGGYSVKEKIITSLTDWVLNEWVLNEWVLNEWVLNEWVLNEWVLNEWVLNEWLLN
jgi:hypothetical protein